MATTKVIIAALIVIAIGSGLFYFNRVQPTRLEKILQNPSEYAEKTVTLEGEVTDRTSFFVDSKFFKLKDKTGEITVVTKKTLPAIRSKVLLKGRLDDAFPLGDQKLIVFMEESIEIKDSAK